MEAPTRSWPTPRGRAMFLALFLLGCAAYPYLSRIRACGPNNFNDYFGVIDQLRHGDRWSPDPGSWLRVQGNEHHVVVPALIYRANAGLFSGDNRGLSCWALLMMALTAIMALVLVDPGREFLTGPVFMGSAGRPPWLPLAALIFPLALTPAAAHNIAYGFSGTMWLTANALSIGSIAVLLKAPEAGPVRAWLTGCLALASLATFTYGTGAMVWPALIVTCAVLPNRDGWLRSIAICGVLAVLPLLLSYQTPGHHPRPTFFEHPHELTRYLVGYLGSPFSSSIEAARSWGLLGVALFLVTLAVGFSRGRTHRALYAPWLGVLAYSLGNAMLTAVARSGFGSQQALASRYATIAALFWIGVLAPLFLYFLTRVKEDQTERWRALAGVVFALWLAQPMWRLGLARIDDHVAQASLGRAAGLALQLGIEDTEMFRALTPAPEQLVKVRSFLGYQRQVPFADGPPEGGPADSSPVPAADTVRNNGAVDRVVRVGDWIRLSGWADQGGSIAGEVRVTDSQRRPLGWVIAGVPLRHIARDVSAGALRSGFVAYVPLAALSGPGLGPAETLPLRLFARFSDRGEFAEIELKGPALLAAREVFSQAGIAR